MENRINYITPDMNFNIKLHKAYEFLNRFITEREFENLKFFCEGLNYKIFKNSALLVIAFYTFKKANFKMPEPLIFKQVFSDPEIYPLREENSISMYDLVRYTRHLYINKDQFSNLY